MPVNIGLFQGLGDPFNELPQKDDAERFSAPEDPVIAAILADPNISPRVKRSLRQEKLNRDAKDRATFRLNRVNKRLAEGDEGAGIISFLGPVPVGFQVGTFAGIESFPIRLAVDIIADPVNLVAGIGALSKLGRAAKFLQQGGKALTPLQKAKQVLKGAQFIARNSVDGNFAKKVAQGVRQGDSKEVLKLFRQAGKHKFSTRELKRLQDIDPALVGLLRNRTREVRGLKAAFAQQDINATIELQKGLFRGLASGQRSILNFGLPFTSKDIGELTVPSAKALASGKVSKTGAQIAEEAPKARTAFKSTAAQFEQGLDVTRSAELTKTIDDGFKGVEDVASGNVAKITGEAGADLTARAQDFGTQFQGRDNAIKGYADDLARLMRIATKGDTELLEAIPRALEGSSQAVKLIKSKGGEAAQNLVAQLSDHLEKFGDVLMDKDVIRSMVDDYVPHIVEFKDQGLKDLFANNIVESIAKGVDGVSNFGGINTARTLPGNKHSLRRVFSNLADLDTFLKNPKLAGAFKVKHRGIDEIYRAYIRSAGVAAIRNDAINMALNTKVNGEYLALAEGAVQGKGASIALRGTYKAVENPLFDKFVFHKDVHPYFNGLYGRSFFDNLRDGPNFINKAFRVFEGANKAVKSSLFSALPLFHGVSLILSNFALLPPMAALKNTKDITKFIGKQLLKDRDGAAEVVANMMSRAFRADGQNVINAADSIKEMRLAGLKLGRSSDAEGFNVYQKVLTAMESVAPPGLKSPITGVKHLNELGDRSLWEFLHSGYKMMAFQHLRQAEIVANPALLTNSSGLAKINREIGQIVNQAYGSLAWEQMLVSPSMREFLRFALIAPDWTTSNLLMARDMVLNAPGIRELGIAKKLTRDVMLRDVRFRWALGYNLRAATYGILFGNLLNRAFTGRWLHENDEESKDPDLLGFKTRIELPYKRADGRRQFMDVSKQFKEPLKAVLDPGKFLTGKMGFLPRVIQTAVVGVDSFGNKVYGDKDGPYRKIVKQIGAATRHFAPIPLQQAVESIRGTRDPRSSAISTFGFSIRSEDKERFDLKKRRAELRRELAFPDLVREEKRRERALKKADKT